LPKTLGGGFRQGAEPAGRRTTLDGRKQDGERGTPQRNEARAHATSLEEVTLRVSLGIRVGRRECSGVEIPLRATGNFIAELPLLYLPIGALQ
jgi:hypothetical protein